MLDAPAPYSASSQLKRAGSDRRAIFTPAENRLTPFPIVLQRSARHSLRKHLLIACVRTTVLLIADIGALLILKGVLHTVRDRSALGSGAAAAAGAILPQGTFPHAQLIVSTLLGLVLLGNYGQGDRRRDLSAIATGVALGLALVYWNRLWSTFSPYLFIGFACAIASTATTIAGVRLLLDSVVRWLRPETAQTARVLLVGRSADARAALGRRPFDDPAEFNVVGYLSVDGDRDPEALGGTSELVNVIAHRRIDTVILCGAVDSQLFSDLLNVCDAAGCLVLALPRGTHAREFEPRLVWRRGEPMMQLTRPSLRGQQLLVKRLLDICVSLVGLLLLSPILLVLAIVVKLTSRGPVIFRQRRVGVGGRTFEMYKFRSMIADAEARRVELVGKSVYGDQRLFKVVGDPRITRVGAFLRRTSLDELPQLWNVLRGDMSLVGPRPPVPAEVALYEEHHYTRFELKPGITGPWQVSGRNRITEFEEVVRLESEYIRQWSIWKDVELLFKTVPAVLRMDGAH